MRLTTDINAYHEALEDYFIKTLILQLHCWNLETELRIARRFGGKAGFDPNQPRVPAGNAGGGEWTGGAGRPGSGLPRMPPRRNAPPKPRSWRDMLISPAYAETIPGAEDELGELEGRPGVPGSHLLVGGGGGSPGPETFKPSERVEGYLNETRKIPETVKEVSRGRENLTKGQLESLERFRKRNNNYKQKKIEVINYSDGRAIFTFRVPADNIPNSYSIYEKQVDAAGNMIITNKITIGPKEELVHVKPK